MPGPLLPVVGPLLPIAGLVIALLRVPGLPLPVLGVPLLPVRPCSILPGGTLGTRTTSAWCLPNPRHSGGWVLGLAPRSG